MADAGIPEMTFLRMKEYSLTVYKARRPLNVKRRKTTFFNVIVAGILFSLLTFLIVFPDDVAAGPGRTIMIHNNTGATLHIAVKEFSTNRNVVIPPNQKKSLLNFLSRGRNVLTFSAKCVRGTQPLTKVIWVSGDENKRREIVVFPQHFGKTAMFDAPRCANSARTTGETHNTWAGTWICPVRGKMVIEQRGSEVTVKISGKKNEHFGSEHRKGGITITGNIDIMNTMKLLWKFGDRTTTRSTSTLSKDGKSFDSNWDWYDSGGNKLLGSGTMYCHK